MRAVRDAALDPDGAADGAVPGAARALLFPGLPAAAAHFAAIEGVAGPLSLIGKFLNHRLVDDAGLALIAEDFFVEFQGAAFLPLVIK